MFYSYYSHENLKNAHKHFDNNKKLLYIPVRTDHPLPKKIYAHHILESFEYAHWLLDTDKVQNKKLSEEIINEALSYQITEKNSSFFGKWMFFSEDISKNVFPHIDNDSKIGIALIQILRRYSDFLNPKLVKKIEKACFTTVFSMMSAYNTPNPLTLIQMSYTSAMCGELYQKPEFLKFAEQLMQNLYNSTIYYDTLYEYLDTSNNVHILELIALMMNDVKSKLCLNVCSTVSDIIWDGYSLHYHYGTKEISGPFSYTHSDFITEQFNGFLNNALTGNQPTSSTNPVYMKCPPKFRPYFNGEKTTEFHQKVVCNGITFPHYRPSIVTSSYMQNDYTLGTANREFFWNKRRPFIGYFGTEKNKYCYKIDVLHDYDSYASAVLHSVQMKGHVLGHITFLTNRGDKHINLDAPTPSITTEDFRIRFSVTGKTEFLKISHSQNSIEIRYSNVTLIYKIPYICIDGYNTKCRFSESDNSIFFDIIIYSGKKTVIDFTKIEKAVMEFVFLITSTGKKINLPERTLSDGFLESSLKLKKHILTLRTPVKPGYDCVCLTVDKQFVNNISLEEYVTQINENLKNYIFIEKTNQKNPVFLPISVFDADESDLNRKIASIQYLSLDEIPEVLEETLRSLSSSEYSITLRKRLAVQIVINIFESAKNIDYRLREIIDRKHSDIFRKITLAESYEEIHKNITDMYNIISAYNHNPEINNASVIENMFSIIDENLLNPNLSLDFIADTLGYSASYLSRLFIKNTGAKYVTYIQEKKLLYAVEQLKTNTKTMKEVSDEIGYSHPNSFMRVFKQRMGMTVSAYLKNETRM